MTGFIKREPVLTAALILAVVSCFFNPPGPELLSFIDFRTLTLLFCLMAVMKGFQKTGLFSVGARALLGRTKSLRQTSGALILLCFFTSMLITNDVALITFVPFAIEVLTAAGKRAAIPLTVAMQTVAANLGSILTPLGNPQNLYLYSLSGMSVTAMVKLMLPFWTMSLVLVTLSLLIFKKDAVSQNKGAALPSMNKISLTVYTVLFAICMLCVLRLIRYIVLLAAVLAVLLAYDRRVLLKVDYSLLLTFVGFFIFIGNMSAVPAVNGFLRSIIGGREVLVSVLSSQVISNVPAALLLSGFTSRLDLLMIGVNIGGLGTLIASMASLISYKYIAGCDGNIKGRYFGLFTGLNLVFLAALSALAIIIA